MSKKHPEGVVLAMAAPHHDERRAAAGEQVTVYWEGARSPKHWASDQRDAARFVDEHLALHTLRALRPDALERNRVWTEPALHQRNGGPTTPLIAASPAGTGEPDRPDAEPEPEQGDLFGGAI